MKKLAFFAFVSAFALGGCSYPVQTANVAESGAPSPETAKAAGKWALYVDPRAYQATFRPDGIVCPIDTYHLDLTTSFREAAAGIFRNIAAEIEPVDHPLPAQDLASLGYAGEIAITGEDIRHQLSFSQGFFLAAPEAEITLDARLIATWPKGTLLQASASGTGEGSAGGWIGCGRGADALSQAAEAAMKDLLGKLAERFSTAPQVRSAATEGATHI
ncbi:MAG TPA: hypothetical protein VG848_12510 [Acetobacteraceae bacterium]|nr:hypothetical protein [Acetobacteraceae bacterium]